VAAADQTTRRTRQEHGRSLRRRVGWQCARAARWAGSLIPHAGAVGALMIAMIEPPLGRGAMPPARFAHRRLAAGNPTRRGTVRVTAIAGPTDRERPTTAAARLLAKRTLHGVAALRATTGRSPTCHNVFGLTRLVAAPRRSTEGPEGQTLGPHLRAARGVPYRIRVRTATAAAPRPGLRALRAVPGAPLDPAPRPRPSTSIDGYAAECPTGTSLDMSPESRVLT
jgi:hypothetical protein